jgi:hypothetical protein
VSIVVLDACRDNLPCRSAAAAGRARSRQPRPCANRHRQRHAHAYAAELGAVAMTGRGDSPIPSRCWKRSRCRTSRSACFRRVADEGRGNRRPPHPELPSAYPRILSEDRSGAVAAGAIHAGAATETAVAPPPPVAPTDGSWLRWHAVETGLAPDRTSVARLPNGGLCRASTG